MSVKYLRPTFYFSFHSLYIWLKIPAKSKIIGSFYKICEFNLFEYKSFFKNNLGCTT